MRREAMAAPLGTGFVVSAVLALRVSFGLAATAVDVPWSPRRSWSLRPRQLAGRSSRRCSWSCWPARSRPAVAVVVPLALLRNLGADTAAAIVTWTIAILVSYGGAAAGRDAPGRDLPPPHPMARGRAVWPLTGLKSKFAQQAQPAARSAGGIG
jgi:hypothetical protein